jgi:hypothetical protein
MSLWSAQNPKSAPGAHCSRRTCKQPGHIPRLWSSQPSGGFPATPTGGTPTTTATGCPTTATPTDGAFLSRLQRLQLLAGSPKQTVQWSPTATGSAGACCSDGDSPGRVKWKQTAGATHAVQHAREGNAAWETDWGTWQGVQPVSERAQSGGGARCCRFWS